MNIFLLLKVNFELCSFREQKGIKVRRRRERKQDVRIEVDWRRWGVGLLKVR